MRLRFQKRVDALKRAGIPVNQKTVYDPSIEVGVPVPAFGTEKHAGRRQSDYAENKLMFMVDFLVSGMLALFKALFSRRRKSVFSDQDNTPSASPPRGTAKGDNVDRKELKNES